MYCTALVCCNCWRMLQQNPQRVCWDKGVYLADSTVVLRINTPAGVLTEPLWCARKKKAGAVHRNPSWVEGSFAQRRACVMAFRGSAFASDREVRELFGKSVDMPRGDGVGNDEPGKVGQVREQIGREAGVGDTRAVQVQDRERQPRQCG